MKTRKLQCRIQLAASEPVAYQLVVVFGPWSWGKVPGL